MKHLVRVFSVASMCVACGSSVTGTPLGSGKVNGVVAGKSITVNDAIFYTTPNASNGNQTAVYISDFPGTCDMLTGKALPDASPKQLTFALVTKSGPLAAGQFSTNISSNANNYVFAVNYSDFSDDVLYSANGQGSSVTIDSADDTTITGSFAFTMTNMQNSNAPTDAITGTFTAGHCDYTPHSAFYSAY